MTARPLLIVADDLTGACDTAGAVVAVVGPVTVQLLGRQRPGPLRLDAAVSALDLDSRSAPVAQAVDRTVAAVSVAPGDVYLKIDSTLRGHVVATVAAAAGAFRAMHADARVVVCPAFPACGRLVSARRVVVDGQPVHSDALVELAALPGIDVADAASDDDLATIANHRVEGPTLWVGSAGLAPHVAAGRSSSPVPTGLLRPAKVVAVAVGSEQRVSAQGAATVAGRADDRVRVVVGDPRRAAFIDDAVSSAAGADALVLTGGYTARRVLERLGISELLVCGELEPGIPWSTSDGPVGTIVTKAGGFGDVDTLARLVDRLLHAADSA